MPLCGEEPFWWDNIVVVLYPTRWLHRPFSPIASILDADESPYAPQPKILSESLTSQLIIRVMAERDLSQFFPLAANRGRNPPSWIMRFPYDLWHLVWFLIPADIRLPILFALSTQSSFFASLFVDMPALWADWFIVPDSPSNQSPEFHCSQRIWLWNRARLGSAPPIRLHAHAEASWGMIIPTIVPAECLPFVEHITINVPRVSLGQSPHAQTTDLIEFFSSVSSVKGLHFVSGNDLHRGHPASFPSIYSVGNFIYPLTHLTDLHLTGTTLTQFTSASINLVAVISVTLSNFILTESTGTRLSDVVQTTPNLTRLSILSSEDQFVTCTFWDPPTQGFLSLVPLLQSIEVSGDLIDLYDFLSSFTDEGFPHLRAVSAIFYCHPRSVDYLRFDVIPAFRSEMTWRVDSVIFRESPYTIATRRAPDAPVPMEWDMRWVLFRINPGTIWGSDRTFRIFQSFYRFLEYSMATARPHMRSDETVASYEISQHAIPWCLSRSLTMAGDKSVLFQAMLAIVRQPWRFPLLSTIYFLYEVVAFRPTLGAGFHTVVSSLGALEGEVVGRVIDIHVRVKVTDFLDGGKDYFWFSLRWDMSDVVPDGAFFF